jgi:hypothetical protein
MVHGARFSAESTLEDQANMRVTNGIPLGCSRLLPVDTVNCVQTLKAEDIRTVGGYVLMATVFESSGQAHDVRPPPPLPSPTHACVHAHALAANLPNNQAACDDIVLIEPCLFVLHPTPVRGKRVITILRSHHHDPLMLVVCTRQRRQSCCWKRLKRSGEVIW